MFLSSIVAQSRALVLAVLLACRRQRRGGADYATAYDFSEFYYVTNGKTFQVIVSGNPSRRCRWR
jgi:hypothetical protein